MGGYRYLPYLANSSVSSTDPDLGDYPRAAHPFFVGS